MGVNKTKVMTTISALALAAVALTGCTPSPDTVATVGDDYVLTQGGLDGVVDSCRSVVESSGQKFSDRFATDAMAYLVLGQVYSKIASANGVQITNEDRDNTLKVLDPEGSLTQLRANPGCAPVVDSVLNMTFANQMVGESILMKDLSSIKVQINPAYGKWSSVYGLMPGESGSLSSFDSRFDFKG